MLSQRTSRTPVEPPQGYATIPRWILHDSNVPWDAKLVYLILSSRVGSKSTAWPSHQNMATELGISKTTVKKAVAWLADHGHISVIRRPLDNGDFQSNEYKVIAGSAPQVERTSPVPKPRLTRVPTEPRAAGDLGQLATQGVGRHTTHPGRQAATNVPQGTRVSSERTSATRLPPGVDALFDEFWTAYPRKHAKGGARTAFERAIRKGTEPRTIIEGAVRLAADPNLPDKQYIPHPTTWLNQTRWADDPLPERHDDRRVEPTRPRRPGADPVTACIPIDSRNPASSPQPAPAAAAQ